jgi:hypothetical protein
MLTRAGIPNDNWKLFVNWNCIPSQAPEELEKAGDIRILATIVHLLRELPIIYNNNNLLHFRVNLTLALYHDTPLL